MVNRNSETQNFRKFKKVIGTNFLKSEDGP